MSKFTILPLPSIRELFSSILKFDIKDDKLAAPWKQNQNHCFWLSRSAWSLNVIARACIQSSKEDKITIWVPDFFCDSTLEPLRFFGVNLVFYPITLDLQPDLDWCRAKTADVKPDIFVLVHYFGQPNSVDKVVAFCKDTGAWLIEDAVHVLGPTPGVGSSGDCVIYSPYKHLAIPDGALLIVCENGPSKFCTNSHVIGVFNDVISETLKSSQNTFSYSILWLIKKILLKVGFNRKYQIVPLWTPRTEDKVILPPPKMSRLAKHLLNYQLKNLKEFALKRKRCAQVWQETLVQNKSISVSLNFASIHATPYMACVIGKNEQMIKQLYLLFQKNKLPILTWPDLPAEVVNDLNHHRNALFLRTTRLYFPVHQTMKLSKIAKTVRNVH